MPKTVFQLALDSEEKVVHSLILEMGKSKLRRKHYLPEAAQFVCLFVFKGGVGSFPPEIVNPLANIPLLSP